MSHVKYFEPFKKQTELSILYKNDLGVEVEAGLSASFQCSLQEALGPEVKYLGRNCFGTMHCGCSCA